MRAIRIWKGKQTRMLCFVFSVQYTNFVSPLKMLIREDFLCLFRILKPRIFSLVCDQGTESCRRKANDLFGQWLEKNVTVPTSLRGVVYKWGTHAN